ncbi:LamG-like jellyroll fold domain-containing protein [Flavobacterium ammonificans]|uniref:F5/8 type C domain-containing protein n=1 Tax=Flavobacterium ammonificans TaxID=1751056 RepID=A0ABN6KSV4_9FLAO|nr:LamG-like jellyroll fold domain-containing protein [Flavobacterium ammonificans]BDB52200.1 hypothetical protein GENT11_05120 [Flavobacterium ammonificans]
MKKLIYLILLVQFVTVSAQIGLPVQNSLLPKNSLVVDYDFSKPISYTRGSTSVNNMIGNGSGAATLVQSPNFMNSLGFLSFNGTNQYLVSPNFRSYFKSLNSSIQKSFTMSLWVYPTKSNGIIVSELDSQTPSGGWHASNIEIVNNTIYYRIWNGTAITSLSSVSLNQWYHLAMVYDGVRLKAYLNGVLQGTQTNDREIPTSGQYYTLAASETTHMGSGGVNGGFNCAQFKLFQLPLTDSDILQEYNFRKDEFNYTLHSPSTNTNPTYWSVSSAWNSSTGSTGASDAFSAGHYTPWLNSSLGWAAQQNNTSQFIILNYDEPVTMNGIVTQGRASNGGQWVSSAHIDVSLNGSSWTRVMSNATLNTNSVDDVRVLFPSPVFAKYIRVSPLTWINHITMRLGVIVEPQQLVTDGLVVRLDAANSKSYPGTGTAWNDVNSNSFPFTLTNGPVYDTNGFFDFDGANDYAVRAHSTALKPTTAITLEQWLSADDWNAGTSSSNYKCSLSCTSGGGYSHNIWSGIFTSYIYAGGGYRTPTANVSSLVGWHHFVTTFDGRYTRLYVDGELKSTVDIGTSGNLISYVANSIFVGAEASGGTAPEGFYWDGKIGTTAIYNRALSATEVTQNYTVSKPRYDFDLVMDLAIAPSSGSTWVDQSGNGNNGTLVGSPTYVSNNGGGYRTTTGQYIATNYNLPSSFTISIVASLNPTSFWATFWGNEVWSSNRGYLSYFNSTTGLEVGSPPSLASFAVSGINTIHIWDFVVSGNSVTLYRDGVSLGTKTFSTPTGLATNGLYFGARHSNAGTGFTDICPGTYYNMKVYKKALIPDEITNKFNQMRSLYGL